MGEGGECENEVLLECLTKVKDVRKTYMESYDLSNVEKHHLKAESNKSGKPVCLA